VRPEVRPEVSRVMARLEVSRVMARLEVSRRVMAQLEAIWLKARLEAGLLYRKKRKKKKHLLIITQYSNKEHNSYSFHSNPLSILLMKYVCVLEYVFWELLRQFFSKFSQLLLEPW